MRGLLHLGILLLLWGSAATITVAQVQITPTPLPSTPLISGLNAQLCSNSCDNAAMNCQNSCLTNAPTPPPSPVIGLGLLAPAIAGGGGTTGPAACPLNCTSQQLVCKQACARQQ
jgi:hypothetical protein